MKKVVLALIFALTFINANYINHSDEKEVKAFREGFQLAISAGKSKEYKIQGDKNDSISFDEYIVVIDSAGFDDGQKLSIQVTGWKYYDSVRLDNDWIVLGNFSSKGNAETFKRNINNSFMRDFMGDRKAFVYQNNKNNSYVKDKSIYSDITLMKEKEVKNNIKVLMVNNSQMPKQSKKKKKSDSKKKKPKKVIKKKVSPKTKKVAKITTNFDSIIKESNIKVDESRKDMPTLQSFNEIKIIEPKKAKATTMYKFILKNEEAITFSNIGSKEKNIPNIDLKLNETVKNEAQIYLSKTITTNSEGDKLIKVLNDNIYFYYNDIIIVDRIRL